MAQVDHSVLLVRHGEIGLKSHAVRARLERKLSERMEEGFLREDVEGIVTRTQSRHFVEANDLEAAQEVVRRTFGVTTFSPAVRIPSDPETIQATAARYAEAHWPADATSFAIRSRRAGEHSFSSRDMAIACGDAVYRAMADKGVPVRVDLSNPDWALHVEVRHKEAFLYHEKIPGPGGLPLGSQGRLVVWLDSADAAAAAYLMMRRGAVVYPFFLPQVVGGVVRRDATGAHDEAHPARALHEALCRFGAPKHLKPWRIDQDRLLAATGEPLPDQGVPLARLGLDAGTQMMRRMRAQAIVTGETVRAPWATRLPDTHAGMDVPILRPLMGLRRELIDDFREVLGLKRLGGPRRDEAERAFTAGGRKEARTEAGTERRPDAAKEVHGWDPW